MTTNRNLILANIRTTLAAIATGGGPSPGYFQTVTSVSEHFRAATDLASTDFPAVDFFPAKGGNPVPVYFPFNSIEENLDITVIGQVAVDINAADGGEEESRRLLSEIESDIRRALAVDPTRGGYAIETVKAEHGETDEGRPAKQGVQDAVASIVLRFRITYYPND